MEIVIYCKVNLIAEMAEESLFWADQIARIVKERVDQDPKLKKIVKDRGYICYDEKTPSGHIHIGSGRGWIIHDTVAKAMRDLGLNARFVLSSDDYDPFDKFPSYLDRSKYEKYLGVPFRNIPSPEPGYESYADYYFTEVTSKFEEFGIEAELESTGQRYINGDFNWAIKIALDNADKIREIYKRIYGKSIGAEKLPFNPICEKCGKIGTTLAYEWDPDREVVKYKCVEDLVPWAKGCGYEGEISPYDGNGKLPWKVEWAAKWPTVGVVFETAGKDHFTKKGSREVAVAIANEVYDFPPPYPSSRTSIGKGYEFFTVGGRKMSTSKGRGVWFADIAEKVPPKILRYLLVRTRPRAVIDFDPYQTNKILLLYDNYDKTERIYFGVEKVNERERAQEKRIYELSYVGKIPSKLPPQLPLGEAAMIVQSVNFDKEKALKIVKKIRKLPEKLSTEDIAYLNDRLDSAIKWVEEFAPEEYKFVVQEKMPEAVKKISEEQKEALKLLADQLSKKEFTKEELEEEIYRIAKETVGSRKFFEASYIALIGKTHGPRLAPFLLTLNREFLVRRFRLEQ